MLKCNGKTFMNLQEAVQWLLNNNALFFMCNEDYAADTEISLEELVNPSPANPKIGSLVLFADGNIAVITGITDDSFIVGSDSINIRAQKAVTNFTIDASQHLIVHYSDGTSDDLGAIFSGDVNITGILTASNAKIFENITDEDGHARFIEGDISINTIPGIAKKYGKWSLSGSHLMVVIALDIVNGATLPGSTTIANINLPDWIKDKIVPLYSGYVAIKIFDTIGSGTDTQIKCFLGKGSSPSLVYIQTASASYSASRDESVRIQFDLLIDNE